MRRIPRLICLLLSIACTPAWGRDAPPLSRTHVVASANPMASDAGLAILRAGGSALDAAVAMQMVLGVVEPQASGIGGGGFLVHYSAATRTVTTWDGRETAPAGATERLFLDERGAPLPFPAAVVSGLSIGVPGAMRLLEETHRRFGKLPWARLFVPAIRLAEEGFPAPPRLAMALAGERALKEDPQAQGVYFGADGAPVALGAVVRNPRLAATLRLLAEKGADAFYTGPLAEEIVAAVRRGPRPGTMTLADLAGYRAVERPALCATYRERKLCGMGPPSSGPMAIFQVLATAPASADPLLRMHGWIEASKLAFADRARYLADPAFHPVPAAGLLDPGYLAQRGALISPDRAIGKAEPGLPPGAATVPAPATGKPEGGTSHLVAVDRDGDAVSFTTTVESPFGARRMAGGFILNNELTDFGFLPVDEGRTVANRPQPGKRPRSSMSPVIGLEADGRFALAVGSAGGARIIGDVLHTLLGMLDDDLDVQAAIDRPRVSNRNEATEIEAGPDAVRLARALRGLSQAVEIAPHRGGLAGVRARYAADGRLLGYEGGADRRRDGVARGE